MESDSDCVSIIDSWSVSETWTTLEDMNIFLDETPRQPVKVTDYFLDPEKFLKSC